MPLTPVGRLKVALRAARRRRYGYAALRVFRGGLAGAVREELRRSIGPRPYVTQREALWSAYRRGLALLRARFPSLDLADPRALPALPPPAYDPPRVQLVGNLHELLARVCCTGAP